MSSEILQLSMSMVITAGCFVLIWLVTRFYKPESLETKYVTPWKEAALAIGFVIGLFLIIAVVFFYMEQSAGGPVGTSRQFDVRRALAQWGVYAIISFIPISVIIKIRKQSFETIGVTRKNVKLSLGIGLLLSLLLVSFSITEQF
jgi:uncharacterized membrane protein YhdT